MNGVYKLHVCSAYGNNEMTCQKHENIGRQGEMMEIDWLLGKGSVCFRLKIGRA